LLVEIHDLIIAGVENSNKLEGLQELQSHEPVVLKIHLPDPEARLEICKPGKPIVVEPHNFQIDKVLEVLREGCAP